MNYDTFIFDLDGTLLDTLDDLWTSCNHALRWGGMGERTRDEVRLFVGNGVKRLIERAVPDGADNPRFNDVFDEFRRYYSIHCLDRTAPYRGIEETLTELKRRGKYMAVVSNKLYTATEKLCRRFFSDTISVVIGDNAGIAKKPAPDTVIEALRQLGVTKEKAVYIGDSDVDILTASASHIPCVSVTWGFRSRRFLINHGARTLIDRPEELLA